MTLISQIIFCGQVMQKLRKKYLGNVLCLNKLSHNK
jgi:hypothetical protein